MAWENYWSRNFWVSPSNRNSHSQADFRFGTKSLGEAYNARLSLTLKKDKYESVKIIECSIQEYQKRSRYTGRTADQIIDLFYMKSVWEKSVIIQWKNIDLVRTLAQHYPKLVQNNTKNRDKCVTKREKISENIWQQNRSFKICIEEKKILLKKLEWILREQNINKIIFEEILKLQENNYSSMWEWYQDIWKLKRKERRVKITSYVNKKFDTELKSSTLYSKISRFKQHKLITPSNTSTDSLD